MDAFTVDETGSNSTLLAAYSSNATHALPSILANTLSTLYKAVATAQGRTPGGKKLRCTMAAAPDVPPRP